MNSTTTAAAPQAAATDVSLPVQSPSVPASPNVLTIDELVSIQRDQTCAELTLHWGAGQLLEELATLPRRRSSRQREAVRRTLRWDVETARNLRVFARTYSQADVASLIARNVPWAFVQHLVYVTDTAERARLEAECTAGRISANRLKAACAPWKAGSASPPQSGIDGADFDGQMDAGTPSPAANDGNAVGGTGVSGVSDAVGATATDPAATPAADASAT